MLNDATSEMTQPVPPEAQPSAQPVETPTVPQPVATERATGLKGLLAKFRGMFGGKSEAPAVNAQAEMPAGMPSTPVQSEVPQPPTPPTATPTS